jgi:hypothetical protein
MGKGTRERARRAGPAKLILPQENERRAYRAMQRRQREAAAQTLEPPKTEKPAWMCRVVGCRNLSLAGHDGPDGIVWLCGSCSRIAVHNLRQAELAERFTEAIAELYRPALEAHERRHGWKSLIYTESHLPALPRPALR